MKFDIITIFPKMFSGYLNESILKRAQNKGFVAIDIHDLRPSSANRHHKVDDAPYGGGPGMVMGIEPFFNALKTLGIRVNPRSNPRKSATRIILTSAKGKLFDAKDAARLAKYKRLVILCGRYEGVDERVAKYLADEEVSIGPYVLTGGELAAMVIVDAVSRHPPGVLGHQESLEELR